MPTFNRHSVGTGAGAEVTAVGAGGRCRCDGCRVLLHWLSVQRAQVVGDTAWKRKEGLQTGPWDTQEGRSNPLRQVVRGSHG